MHHTTTRSPWTKTLLLATSASIATLSYAGDPSDVLQVTKARGWVSTDSSAKETMDFTQDDCESNRGASSFAEMPLESACSVWVDAPGDNFEELASWAGAESYAGITGWQPEIEGHSAFVVFNTIESALSTDPDSSASAFGWTLNTVEFSLNERAHVVIEACFVTQEFTYASLQITNDESQESAFSFAVTDLYDQCQAVELELPAGNYTLRAQTEGELTGHGELELEAAMGAGISARALTPAERADINRDGSVDGGDLLKVIAYWGSDIELVDINQDGTVNGGDITMLFAYWS